MLRDGEEARRRVEGWEMDERSDGSERFSSERNPLVVKVIEISIDEVVCILDRRGGKREGKRIVTNVNAFAIRVTIVCGTRSPSAMSPHFG